MIALSLASAQSSVDIDRGCQLWQPYHWHLLNPLLILTVVVNYDSPITGICSILCWYWPWLSIMIALSLASAQSSVDIDRGCQLWQPYHWHLLNPLLILTVVVNYDSPIAGICSILCWYWPWLSIMIALSLASAQSSVDIDRGCQLWQPYHWHLLNPLLILTVVVNYDSPITGICSILCWYWLWLSIMIALSLASAQSSVDIDCGCQLW